jgi:hydrogenase/urease accessory protein HupE
MGLGSQSGKTGRRGGTVFFLLATSTAQAHLLIEGAGDLVNGAVHPFFTPAHALVLAGFALLLGQQVPFQVGLGLRVFAGCSALGLLGTLWGPIPQIPEAVLLGYALVLGALVASERKLPTGGLAGLGGLAALVIGLDSGLESTVEANAPKTLLGNWLSMNAVTFYLAVCVSHGANQSWARAGIRVLGSWIIAISLLVLAFTLKG